MKERKESCFVFLVFVVKDGKMEGNKEIRDKILNKMIDLSRKKCFRFTFGRSDLKGKEMCKIIYFPFTFLCPSCQLKERK